MPPTLKTIEELLSFSDTAELFAATRAQRIRPTIPAVFGTTDGFGVRLPNHPEYTLDACKEPSGSGGASRIVLEGGIWKTRSV